MPYAQTQKREQDYPTPSLISLLPNSSFDLQAPGFRHGGEESQLVDAVHGGVTGGLLAAARIVRRSRHWWLHRLLLILLNRVKDPHKPIPPDDGWQLRWRNLHCDPGGELGHLCYG
uniref:Uncharacterized protein n=1 Tax=Arundo donax TaxID=35708 RepID=A0A0A8ZG32_ARUDO